jgi:transposase-like protein
MAERRRYTRKTKAAAIIAATVSTAHAAALEMGIPDQTLRYWLDQPEFATLRNKTREEMAAGSFVLAQLAQQELTKKIRAGEVEPRDLAVILGIAIDKGQLLAGAATSRTETRAITDGMDDHERQNLRDAIDTYLKGLAVEIEA